MFWLMNVFLVLRLGNTSQLILWSSLNWRNSCYLNFQPKSLQSIENVHVVCLFPASSYLNCLSSPSCSSFICFIKLTRRKVLKHRIFYKYVYIFFAFASFHLFFLFLLKFIGDAYILTGQSAENGLLLFFPPPLGSWNIITITTNNQFIKMYRNCSVINSITVELRVQFLFLS